MEQDNNLKLQFSLINIFVLFLFAVIVGAISSLTTYSLLSPKLFNQLPSDVIPQTQPSDSEGKPNVLPTSFPQVSKVFDVVLKENPTDKLKTDIYLQNKKTGEQSLFITLAGVNRNTYHNTEYHNGNLYITRKTGGNTNNPSWYDNDDSNWYDNNPNWTDELWKYNQQKQGLKIYSNRGLDFRVSADENFIAVVIDMGGIEGKGNLAFIKNNGEVIKILTTKELGFSYIQMPIVAWSQNFIWTYENIGGPAIGNIVKINAKTFQITKFDVSSLPIQVAEFDLNPTKEKIVFDDYPAMFDVDSSNEFRASKKTVTLFIYDLNSKTKQIIVTSITKAFKPKWIDENTVEYDNPSGEGRITKIIP